MVEDLYKEMIETLKTENDNKFKEGQTVYRTMLDERRGKMEMKTDAERAKIACKEQEIKVKNLESQLVAKGQDLDSRRKDLEELQNSYHTQIEHTLQMQNACFDKEAKIKDVEGELKRLKNGTQTPEKKRKLDKEVEHPTNTESVNTKSKTVGQNSQGVGPKVGKNAQVSRTSKPQCSGHTTDPPQD